jgi:hypothetical protein
VAVGIGPPIVIRDLRHPHIAVVRFVGPAAVIGELGLIFGILGGKIGLPRRTGKEGVARIVPGTEFVTGRDRTGPIGDELPVHDEEALAVPGDDGALFAGSFSLAFDDSEGGLAALPDVQPVQPFGEDVERRVGRVNLEIARSVERVDPDEDAPGKEMDLGRLAIRAGQGGHLNHGIVVEAEIVLPAELELEPSRAGPDLVARDDDEVHLSGLIAEVPASLNVHVPLDVAHPHIAPVIVAVRLSREHGRDQGHEHCSESDDLSHRRSPSILIKATIVPSVFPLIRAGEG